MLPLPIPFRICCVTPSLYDLGADESSLRTCSLPLGSQASVEQAAPTGLLGDLIEKR